jgi:hypothetical protein
MFKIIWVGYCEQNLDFFWFILKEISITLCLSGLQVVGEALGNGRGAFCSVGT